MKIYTGTSGYSYKEWKGDFYPDDIKPDGMLKFYGSRLPAVEINNTFYRLPNAGVLQNWADQVPEAFRFSIKASRRITHMKRLKEAGDETTYLLDTLETLGERLGVVLFQCPPNLKKDIDRLRGFLDTLRAGCRPVFEFRHETWFDEEVYDLLRERGCVLCLADVDDADAPDLVVTAKFGYLRLRRKDYSPDDIASWVEKVRAQPWEEVYVFFKHEDDASGPGMAEKFLEIAGAV